MSHLDPCAYYDIDYFDAEGSFLRRNSHIGPTDLKNDLIKLREHAMRWHGEWYLNFIKKYNLPNNLPVNAKLGVVNCLGHKLVFFL